MSHIHASPHVHVEGECTYEHTAFGVHLWCSDPSDNGGPCAGCRARIAEQLSETGTTPSVRFPATPVTPKENEE